MLLRITEVPPFSVVHVDVEVDAALALLRKKMMYLNEMITAGLAEMDPR